MLSSCDDGHRGRRREVVVTAPKVVVWPSSGGKERAGRWRGEKREQETGPGSGASQSGWKERTREGGGSAREDGMGPWQGGAGRRERAREGKGKERCMVRGLGMMPSPFGRET